MPYEIIEGFEQFGLTPSVAQDGAEQKYAVSTNLSGAEMATGRVAGTALNLATGAARVLRANGIFNDPEISLGVAVKVLSYPGAGTIQAIAFNANSAATALLDVQLTSAGDIHIRRQLTVQATAVGAWPLDGDWHYINVYLLSDATAGVVEVYVDDVLVLTFNGDTVGTGTEAGTSFTSFSLRNTNTAAQVHFDDLYIFSGDKQIANCAVYTRFPDGAGDEAEFTPSAGNNWECVDEVPADDDTSYVERNGANFSDLYTIDAIPAANVAGVQVNCRVRSTSGNHAVRAQAKVGSTIYDRGSNQTVNTSWQEVRFTMTTNPATAASWVDSEVNAIQVGPSTGT